MKAISLWQPWAQLVVDGRKAIETRHWPCPFPILNELVAIHAAKKVCRKEALDFGYIPKTLPTGAMVGIVRIRNCYQFTEEFFRQIREKEEGRYGNFFPGRWGWGLDLIEKFDNPFPVIGRQGFFNWKRPS